MCSIDDVHVQKKKMFHMCWALSDGSSKLIPIDEQPNHQIVHLFCLGKANGATHEPLDPGPEIDMLALDFLRILLAHVVLLGIDMPLVGSPAVRVKLRDAKGLQELLSFRKTSSLRRPNTYANTFPVW